MKNHPLSFLIVCLLLVSNKAQAQITINPGPNNPVICKGDTQVLGGAPTATGANPPFTYQWSPSTGLSSNTAANPRATPSATTTYTVTVTDNSLNTQTATITVQVKDKYNLHIIASDTTICLGETVYLYENEDTNRNILTGSCNGNNVSPVIGNGTITQPGSVLQPPTIFGNMVNSTRNQMLYTAAELQTALGGPQLIKAVSFNVSLFNSNAFLQNFSIKMGFTTKDSLLDWENNLSQVYSSSNPFQPQAGWNNLLILTTPVYWDGISNLIVDMCNYNPSTFGNQNNKAQCTATPFASYLYSVGNTDQCAGYTTPVKSYLRPNIKLTYCTSATNVTPINNNIYHWLPDTGLQGVFNPHLPNTLAKPYVTTVYSLHISDSYGCAESDSVTIHVNSPVDIPQISTTQFCPGPSGTATMHLSTGTDSVFYQLISSDYSDTLYSGIAVGNFIDTFAPLAEGGYHLQVSDSACPGYNYPVFMNSFMPFYMYPTILYPALCNGYNASACLNFTGGTPPYQYLWDSVSHPLVCLDSLSVGEHFVVITDSNHCSGTIHFTLSQPSPLVVQQSHDTAVTSGYHVILVITGGNGPYAIYWGDSTWANTNLTANHDYPHSGTYYITVTDNNGCVYRDTVVAIYNSINETGNAQPVFNIHLNPTADQLFIETNYTGVMETGIYDLSGKLISQANLTQNRSMDISQLAAGLYIAEIKTGNGRVAKKWVKMQALLK